MPIRLKCVAISGLIVTILGLQAYIGLTYHGSSRWPFTSYPMYATARQEGDRIGNYTLTAVLEDGRAVPLPDSELGIPFWILRKNVIMPILKEAFDNPESLHPICAALPDPEAAVRLDVYDIGITVERDGPRHGAPKRLGSTDLTCNA
jgi:hypothetical protein